MVDVKRGQFYKKFFFLAFHLVELGSSAMLSPPSFMVLDPPTGSICALHRNTGITHVCHYIQQFFIFYFCGYMAGMVVVETGSHFEALPGFKFTEVCLPLFPGYCIKNVYNHTLCLKTKTNKKLSAQA